MKNMLSKCCLPVIAALSLLFTSCDSNDQFLEDKIVGSWSSVYEDATVFEEEVYDFDHNGCWTYRYVYENMYGEDIHEVDAGTYYISYGQLKLKSKFNDKQYSYSLSIYSNKMILRDGDYYAEFYRYR